MNDKQESSTAMIAPQENYMESFKAQVEQAKSMRLALKQVMGELMIENVHYGIMPGTTPKEDKDGKKETPRKVLFKAGAEMLCNVFHFRPEFRTVSRIEEPTFIHFEVECTIKNIQTGVELATATGSANTREERYYNQCTSKLCPQCHKPAIFKSKNPGEGWFCWVKKGGCGATFDAEDKKVLEQSGELTPIKVWGLHNTIVQQSNKRAMVAAVRLATACSDSFTQDMLPDPTDGDDGTGDEHPNAPRSQSRSSTQSRTTTTTSKAGATQVRDLNDELRKQSIGTTFPEDMPKNQREDEGRKVRLSWVNQMLEDDGLPKVASMMDLTPDLATKLIDAAKAGRMPKGW